MSRRRQGKRINGWLIIDKPAGMTSTAVVGRVKRLTEAAKAGHGGTLDPLATGILPIALGEATKTVLYVMDAVKRYRFTVRFGQRTTTDDSEGEVIAASERRPDDAAIAALLPAFTGTIMQRPPDFAAVKIAGERAYDIARRGDAVDLPERPVRIDALVFVERPDPDHAVFEAVCGKGAYIRAIARDLGERLGCHGHVTALRRLQVGPFRTDRAVGLDALVEIVKDDSLPQVLVSVSTALADIPALAVTEPQAARLRSGHPIRISPRLVIGETVEGGTIKVLAHGDLVALGQLRDGELSPLRVFTM
jgi:tRNA pseudouridine55 synthase